jgi:prophage DNA circulation protein
MTCIGSCNVKQHMDRTALNEGGRGITFPIERERERERGHRVQDSQYPSVTGIEC